MNYYNCPINVNKSNRYHHRIRRNTITYRYTCDSLGNACDSKWRDDLVNDWKEEVCCEERSSSSAKSSSSSDDGDGQCLVASQKLLKSSDEYDDGWVYMGKESYGNRHVMRYFNIILIILCFFGVKSNFAFDETINKCIVKNNEKTANSMSLEEILHIKSILDTIKMSGIAREDDSVILANTQNNYRGYDIVKYSTLLN